MTSDRINASHAERYATSELSGARRRRLGGFTLTELVVTCAILLLLVALMGPTLGRVRLVERDTRCDAILRQFGVGLAMYSTEEQGWIPGVNTSGVAIRSKKFHSTSDPNGIHQSHLPVQSFDFMSPLLPFVTSGNPPANRAERWENLLTEFGCPSRQAVVNYIWFGDSPDQQDFPPGVWPSVSYLMPTYFSLWGDTFSDHVVGIIEGPRPITLYAKTTATFSSVNNSDYVSRLEEIGPADRKIFVADGTRYLSSVGNIELDVGIDPSWFGSFTSMGGWWPGANAYGVRAGGLNWDGDPISEHNYCAGGNLPISYRHGPGVNLGQTGHARDNKGAINAVFFDGHVRRMNDRQSRAIDMWYPTGSIVQDPIGMTTVPNGYEIP